MTVVATNKKAYHEFFIEETFEAGIQLVGSEVKSIRNGGVNLKDSFAIVKNGELFLINAHISPYKMGSFYNPDPRRERRLLMHKREIDRIAGKVQQKGYSIVVTKMYFKQSLVKVEVALAKGKELHDKRNALKEKQLNREVSRALADYR
ncbi:MAG: SsrA-binding protein SmpB [Clostridiales bacterium]|jgi:SsrA-binding protein|nr:SsrA-binding protein SmpB [Clostridiales bacterium]MDY4655024.1 SsrA-binding protein SmpB [Eubacteriales bacterium]